MKNKSSEKIYIILVNYKGNNDTITCIDSVLESTYQNYQLIVVDNSPDEEYSLQLYKDLKYKKIKSCKINENEISKNLKSLIDSKVIIIRQNKNGGFASANNVGIKYGLLRKDSMGFILLNNDTEIKKDTVSELVNSYSKYGNDNCYGGKIFYYSEPDKIWYDDGSFNYITGKAKHRNLNCVDKTNISQIYETQFITFCYVLIPLKIIEEIGLIEEKYFMYCEDLDYCYRCVMANKKLLINPNSIVYHKVGSSSGGQLTEFSAYWSYKNEIRFNLARKDKLKIVALLYLFLTRPLIYLKWLLKRKINIGNIMIKATHDALNNK